MRAQDTAQTCPKCGGALEARVIGGVEAALCAECHGLWLEHDAIIAYMKEHLETQGLPSKTVGLLQTPPVPTGLQCPSCCDATMFSLKLRGIEVEQCGRCRGTYFDAGELNAIAKRLGFATRDSIAVEAKRAAREWRAGQGRDVDRMMGDAIETALGGFDVDI